jgi:hypothetical protein
MDLSYRECGACRVARLAALAQRAGVRQGVGSCDDGSVTTCASGSNGLVGIDRTLRIYYGVQTER